MIDLDSECRVMIELHTHSHDKYDKEQLNVCPEENHLRNLVGVRRE